MRTKVIMVLVGLVGIGLSISAATITVTTTNPAVAVDGQCSLIEAIVNGNADAQTHADCEAGSGADVIELASSATYELNQVNVTFNGPNGLPIVGSAITIEGHGSTIRRAVGAPDFRFFLVEATGNLTFHDVTLTNGSNAGGVGGAMFNLGGTVVFSQSTVTGNTASGAGGIYNNSGTMTITDSEVSFNTGTAGVGGIVNTASTGDAVMTIKRSLIRDNEAIDSSAGGFYSTSDGTWLAELHISGSEITGNIAEFKGGAVRSKDSIVSIVDSTVSDNQTFSATAYSMCGGLALDGGAVEIRRSTISGNTTESLADLSGFGGGICTGDNTTIIANSTISGNEAWGAATPGGSMTGRGGGVMVVGGASYTPPSVDTLMIIEDSTILDNTAETFGGGIAANRYVGTMAVTVELRNTIVAENFEGGGAVLGNCVEESPATVSSLDFNLADDVTCNLVGTDDLVVVDVMLGVLADNGGPTLTHLPEIGSPAIDSGDDALCPATDQRGYMRPWDGDGNGQVHCDRGAVELNAHFADGFETGDTSAWSNTVP